MELPLTPIDFLLRARRLFPDREGLIQHEGGARARVFTYADMAERAARMAQVRENKRKRDQDREAGMDPGVA